MNFKQFPLKNVFETTAYAVFGVLLLRIFFYFLNYHYQIITCIYPQDWNEGANMLPVDLLTQGKNPFDLSSNPQYTNIYGIFYPLLVCPLAKIWGNTLLLHHIVAGFFIFASCLIIALVLRKNKLPWLLSCAGAMTFYPFLIYPTTTIDLAGPHALGFFLFLMTFFIPYLFNYSKTSLGLSILFGILAFYTKLFCILGIPLTASYIFLFKSKKMGTLYGLIFLILFIPSIDLANNVMNCYFNNVFFVTFNWTAGQSSVAHAMVELSDFYRLQKPLFLLVGINLVLQGFLYFKNFSPTAFQHSFSKINLFTWQEPLFKWNFNISIYGLIIGTLVIYFSMGRSLGQRYEYPFLLMSPFFILYIFTFLNKQRLITFLSMPLIIMSLSTVASHFPKNFHEFDKNWETVDYLVANNNNIFANPLLIPILLKYHRPVYDSGHSEYFQSGGNRKILGFQLPSPPEIQDKNAEYWRSIWDQVTQKKFDFLMMYSNYHPFMSDLCVLYYHPIGSIQLGNFDSTYLYNFVILIPK